MRDVEEALSAERKRADELQKEVEKKKGEVIDIHITALKAIQRADLNERALELACRDMREVRVAPDDYADSIIQRRPNYFRKLAESK